MTEPGFAQRHGGGAWWAEPLMLAAMLLLPTAGVLARASADREVMRLQDFGAKFTTGQKRDASLRLVRAMLPAPVVALLRDAFTGTRMSLPRHMAWSFSRTCVLQSDIVGFTSMSGSVQPEQLCAFLHDLFSAFDHLAEELGVVKIETIGENLANLSSGLSLLFLLPREPTLPLADSPEPAAADPSGDAYVAATGCIEPPPGEDPAPTSEDALRIAAMACRMQALCAEFVCPDGSRLVQRVGLHCGPSIAAVTGGSIMRYHLFGRSISAVNNLEQACPKGDILCSQAFLEAMGPLGRQFVHAEVQEARVPLGPAPKPVTGSVAGAPHPGAIGRASTKAYVLRQRDQADNPDPAFIWEMRDDEEEEVEAAGPVGPVGPQEQQQQQQQQQQQEHQQQLFLQLEQDQQQQKQAYEREDAEVTENDGVGFNEVLWWRVMACVACAAACAQLVAWRTRALRLAALVAEKASLVAQATELQRQVRIGGAALSRVLTEREGLAEKTSGLEVALTKAKQLADAARLEAAALVQERGTLLARVVRLEDDCQKLTSAAEAAEASVEAGGAHPIDPAPRPTPTPTSALVSAPMSTLRGAWARDASATPPGASDSSDAEKKSGIPRPRSRQQSKAAVPEPAAASPTVAKGVLSTVKAPVSPHTCHSLSPRRWPASAAAASPPSPAATPPSAVATPPESRPPAAGHDNSRTGGSVKSGGARRSGASVGSAASSLTARARGLLTAYEGKLRGEGAWLDTVRQQRDALLGLLDGDDEDVPTTAAAPVTPRSALTQQPGDSPTTPQPSFQPPRPSHP